MNILLLGASGQLGRTFLDDAGLALRGKLTATSRSGAQHETADLAQPARLLPLLERVRPDVIVNAAAYTAVDRAEQEEALAMRVNGEAVGVIGRWAAAHDALVIHYSTDYVFDGRQSTPYAIDAPTAPLGAYGRSKLAGEAALRGSGAAHLIFRTSWVYAAHGQNFLRTMLRIGGEREELRVVADQHGAPTDTRLLVRATLAALETWLRAGPNQRQRLEGVHHLAASGRTSWQGFAQAIFAAARAQGLIQRCPRIIPIRASDFPALALRPASSLLDTTGFQRQFAVALPDWEVGLTEVIDELARAAGPPS